MQPAVPVAEQQPSTPVPAFLAKAPDASELRAHELQMHRAQVQAEAAAREEPAQSEPVRAAPAPAPEPKPEPARLDTRDTLESAGLQMVETRPDGLRAPAPELQPTPLGRPRRERPRQSADEELVQVETKQ